MLRAMAISPARARAPGVALRVAQALLGLSFLGASCGQSAIGILPGVLNDPANLTLRRELLAYGTGAFCAEALRRSMPLKLRDEDPATGRFFPQSCITQDLANKNLFVQFGGFGYVWTNLTRRMAFDAGAGVEYETDFQLDGSTMYVYFRQRSTTTTRFTTRVVEQPVASVVGNLPLGIGGQAFASSLGAEIVKGEIARGFTVIRDKDGSVQFGLGMIPKGQRPAESVPFRVTGGGKLVLANERSEVHQDQRDFVGPFEIPEGKSVTLAVAVDGAPAIDVLVFPRSMGEPWLQTYTVQAGTTPPPGPPVLNEAVGAGPAWQRTVSLPAGAYYLVLDNTPTAGLTQPVVTPGDDRAALVSYALTLQ
jgi:hypothetical protein